MCRLPTNLLHEVTSRFEVAERTCLCLLDLVATFDTIDHNILITRLSSSFGINGSVLSWYKSYSSRSFRLKCDNNLSSFHTSSCGVPQGSVLGPLLFIMYTTPLSTLISSLPLTDHQRYADDTQLFFSFHPLNFDSSISHLQYALQQISSWMTANLLTVNSSKTEFLLIGLINQLAKIHNSSLDTSRPIPIGNPIGKVKDLLTSG